MSAPFGGSTREAMRREFVFWSTEYMVASALGVLTALAWVLVSGAHPIMLGACAVLLVASVVLARRARVAVALQPGELRVRAGLGPAVTLALPAAEEDELVDPYRDAEAPTVNQAEVRVMDHAKFSGPTIEGKSVFARSVGNAIRLFRWLVTLGGPHYEVSEKLGQFTVEQADGSVRRFIVPADGAGNEDRIVQLQAALNDPAAALAAAPRGPLPPGAGVR